MKKFLIVTISAAFAFSPAAFAQAKKKEAAPAKPAETAAPATKPAAAPAEAKVAKPIPMNSRADEIDAAGKTFTQINKDGKKVKHVITDKTEILQGDKPATFGDIKVGDTVAGLRLKKGTDGTEYEVVKITKFGVKAPKAPKAEKTVGEPKKDEKK